MKRLLDLSIKYNYPNLIEENHRDFMNNLLDLVSDNQQFFPNIPENIHKEMSSY